MHIHVRTLRSGLLGAALAALVGAGALGAAAAPVFAQSPATAAPAVALTLDCSSFEALPAQAHAISLPVGGDLVLTICSNASTGFLWTDPVISDAAVLSVFGTAAEPATSPMAGAPGTQDYRFHGEQAGSVSVALGYSQPWEGGTKDVWTIALDVSVVAVTATPMTMAVDCDAFGPAPSQEASTSLAIGDALIVTLCSNASTGFTWADPEISDAAVIALTGTRTDAPASPMPGAPGAQSWAFEALAAGTAQIHLSYSQPWEGGEKDAWTFDLDVTVS